MKWIDAEVNLGQNGQIFDEPELINFPDIVQAHVQEFEAFNRLQPSQSLNLIFREVQSPQNGKRVEALDLRQLVGANKKLLDPEIWQVLNPLNLIPVERQHSKIFVRFKALDRRDIVVIQIEVFEILVGLSFLDRHNLVARIVDPLQIGWRRKIKREFQLIVGGVQFDQVLDVT